MNLIGDASNMMPKRSSILCLIAVPIPARPSPESKAAGMY